ncbi:MAG: histidine phosphatase family protein [Candidatus Micrarchaeota archaeon]|nr:histidine phosphatase family protein [Candidatus Micrarchaeota archaeon]
MRKDELDFSGSWKKIYVEGRRKVPTIYLFRHAQTYFNRDRRFTGWKDSRLTPFGRKQAEKLAKKLRGKKIDVAFQTSLSRSRDTLREVLKYHPECRRVFTDDRMIERSYGRLQGMSHRVYERTHSADKLHRIRRSYGFPPPGGESIRMVERRVLSFIRDLLAYMKKCRVNVAISAHGNSMRPFRRYFEKLTIKQMMALENPWDDYFEYEVRD